MPTTVINLTGRKGLTTDPTYVYIGRPSKWGNPFVIGFHGTREEVITRYKAWIQGRPDLLAAIPLELKGRQLGCWCAPQPCHGDVLRELADGPKILGPVTEVPGY